MGKMKELAQNSLAKDARNLAQATLRLVRDVKNHINGGDLFVDPKELKSLAITIDEAQGEANAILAKTIGE